ncbi:MAG: VanZ family protein, partial [Clostridiales bacterium]
KTSIFICKLLLPNFENWSAQQQLSYTENFQWLIRKAAHFSEYTLLAALFMQAFKSPRITRHQQQFYALLSTILYAISDELHQLFIPGRACQIQDILIDSSGAVLGIILITLFYQLVKKLK